jgi:hypothetical protein
VADGVDVRPVLPRFHPMVRPVQLPAILPRQHAPGAGLLLRRPLPRVHRGRGPHHLWPPRARVCRAGVCGLLCLLHRRRGAEQRQRHLFHAELRADNLRHHRVLPHPRPQPQPIQHAHLVSTAVGKAGGGVVGLCDTATPVSKRWKAPRTTPPCWWRPRLLAARRTRSTRHLVACGWPRMQRCPPAHGCRIRAPHAPHAPGAGGAGGQKAVCHAAGRSCTPHPAGRSL